MNLSVLAGQGKSCNDAFALRFGLSLCGLGLFLCCADNGLFYDIAGLIFQSHDGLAVFFHFHIGSGLGLSFGFLCLCLQLGADGLCFRLRLCR